MRCGMMAIAAMAMLAVAGCGQGPSDKWSGVTHPDTLAKSGLKYYWRSAAVASLLRADEKVDFLYRLDENIYCLTTQGRMIAVDAVTGISKWTVEISQTEPIFPPVHANGVTLTPKISSIGEILDPQKVTNAKSFNAVMINCVTFVMVIDRQSGVVIRNIPFGTPSGHFVANARGDTDGVNFYVGSPDGLYHCIRLQEAIISGTKSVPGNSHNPIAAPVVAFGGRVFVATEVGVETNARVLSTDFEAQNTVPKWDKAVAGSVIAPFYVDDRGIFVPCEDHRVYAFDTMTGAKLWDAEAFITKGLLRSAVQVSANSVFQYSEGDAFYALDVATGRQRWKVAGAPFTQVVGVGGGMVYLRGTDNMLKMADEMTGPPATMTVPLTGMEMFVNNARSPVIYTGTRDGRLFCITPASLLRVTPELLKDTKTRLRPVPATLPASAAAETPK